MKTFIWNTEYDVFAAMAETEEDARKIIKSIHDFEQQAKGWVVGFHGDKFNSRSIEDPADIIIEPNTAKIFDHTNE